MGAKMDGLEGTDLPSGSSLAEEAKERRRAIGVAIACRRSGLVMAGHGGPGCVHYANSMRLLRGEDAAWDLLFGGAEPRLEDAGPDVHVPSGYGIVCVDIDAKRVDVLVLEGGCPDQVGELGVSVRADLESCAARGVEPPIFTTAGLALDAFIGAALTRKEEVDGLVELRAMPCESPSRLAALHELHARLEGVGDLAMATDFRILPPEWKVVHWNSGRKNLAQVAWELNVRGWPMGLETARGWRAHAVEVEGDGAEDRFESWIGSLEERAALASSTSAPPLDPAKKMRM